MARNHRRKGSRHGGRKQGPKSPAQARSEVAQSPGGDRPSSSAHHRVDATGVPVTASKEERSTEVVDSVCDRWIQSRHSLLLIIWRAIRGFWFNSIKPTLLQRETSIVGFVLIGVFWTAVVFLAAIPKIIEHYTPAKEIEANQSWVFKLAFPATVFFVVYQRIYETHLKRFVVGSRRRQEFTTLSYDLARVVREFAETVKPPNRLLDDTIRRLLKCVEAAVRLSLKSQQEHKATIFTFEKVQVSRQVGLATVDSEKTVVKASHRSNHTHMGIGDAYVDCEACLPFHVAKMGRPFVMVNTKAKHPFAMPKDGMLASKFVVPLLIYEPTINAFDCVAVLSIESDRPYHFTGANEKRLYDSLFPYFQFFLVIFKDVPTRIRVETNGNQFAVRAPYVRAGDREPTGGMDQAVAV